jgi:tRNA threonylcarbamoyladenosine biosynthesis protein TsaE
MTIEVKNEADMKAFGAKLGAKLRGGEVIELIGDVGAGKTTFVKGLARGLRIDEDVQSPSFTLSRVYDARDGLRLDHYDFYRLPDAGILEYEFAESVDDPKVITIVEWADVVHDVLPKNRLTLNIKPTSETGRAITVHGNMALLGDITK